MRLLNVLVASAPPTNAPLTALCGNHASARGDSVWCPASSVRMALSVVLPGLWRRRGGVALFGLGLLRASTVSGGMPTSRRAPGGTVAATWAPADCVLAEASRI